jgi:hypothetical protein
MGIVEFKQNHSRAVLETYNVCKDSKKTKRNTMKAKNITSRKNYCGIGACPSVFETDRNSLIVIGAVPASNKLPRNILNKIGKGEVAVEIPKGTLKK